MCVCMCILSILPFRLGHLLYNYVPTTTNTPENKIIGRIVFCVVRDV
jgi:hypothetical protein